MSERVQVAVRIRPFLPGDPDDADLSCIVVDPTHVSAGSRRLFAVDRVFKMEDDTREVFQCCVKPLVDAFLNGFRATVMAYGQTGTGKTYTMSGLTSLALEYVIEQRLGGDTGNLSFQYLEVYGDTLRDLLSDDSSGAPKQLQIYDVGPSPVKLTEIDGNAASSGNGVVVVGANRLRVRSFAEAVCLVEYGARLRATGATNINEHSSRSHSILTVFNHQACAKLHFVDLAGSERNRKTQNVGKRFQESIGINGGLLALGNVIRALSSNHYGASERIQHVPYRSSKLTRLLQDALGGNSKTLFIACVAPDSYNEDETFRTLQYCSLAMKVLNDPVPNYAQLQSEQGGRHCSGKNAAATEAAVGVSKSLKDDAAMQQMRREMEEELAALRATVQPVEERLRVCEAELQKDEIIFTKQIIAMQVLLRENQILKERVRFLEGRPLEPIEGESNDEGAPAGTLAELEGMLLHIQGVSHSDDGRKPSLDVIRDTSMSADAKVHNWEKKASKVWSSERDSGRHVHTVNSASSTVRSPGLGGSAGDTLSSPSLRQTAPFVDRALPTQEKAASYNGSEKAPLHTSRVTEKSCGDHVMLEQEARARDDQLLALAKKALFYQHTNTELQSKLTMVMALLDTEKRESALLRLRVEQMNEVLRNT